MDNVYEICKAYQEGVDAEGKCHNPYSYDAHREAYDAWCVGDIRANTKHPDYYFISYRNIKASGAIVYHYAITGKTPKDWVIEKLMAVEFKDHYSITYTEKVDKVFYDTYKGVFKKGDDLED